MKRSCNLGRNTFIIIVFVCSILLVFPVVGLMKHVQTLLNNDIKVNLTEIVTQNKNVITSKIDVELDNLSIMATQIAEDMQSSNDFSLKNMRQAFSNYTKAHDVKKVFVSDESGEAYFFDGKIINIMGRRYFRLALDGNKNISDKLISRKDGNEVFVFSVPIYRNNKVIGTLQRSYTQKEMEDIFALSLYSSKGFIYVINQEGYILFHSQHVNCKRLSDNYYRDVYVQGNEKTSKKLSQDIYDNKSGFMEINANGERLFASYTKVDEIQDWYLISSVSANAVSHNSDIVVKLFYFILILVVLLFAIIACFFWIFKNKQQKALRKVAYVDSVTKGNTFNKFIALYREVTEKYPDRKLYILKFDIDNFKYINKYYGFDVGDQILKEIINEVTSKLEGIEFIARKSSDNFIVLLEHAQEDRIRDLFSNVQVYEDMSIYYSCGIYPIQDQKEDLHIMIDKASMAANAVKGIMQNKICYYTKEFEIQAKHDEDLKRDVKKALENDEFVPFYQPKVDINTKEIIGAEALVRWKREGVGYVSPFVFVPMCEKSGMIVELDMMMFEKVLIFLENCMNTGMQCYPISVNFSRVNLLNKQLIPNIKQRMEKHHVPSNLIEIELTESDIFDNLETILEFANALHAHGLSLAMDDFGSGYSSLNMLKEIPIDVLKVDKGFLSETGDTKRQKVIFKSMVDMVQQLNIKVVVEGVETIENVKLLKECGCTYAQGYYFAKPMDEECYKGIVKEGKVK